MITFQLETWASYYSDPDREGLWLEHYGELEAGHQNRMKMEPDLASYQWLESQGQLAVLTARSAGRLVGYAVTVIRPHMHYRPTLCGFEDALFLTRGARRGMTGVRLVRAMNEALRKRGVKKVFWHSKVFAPIEGIFRLLGMKKTDEIWSMWLED